MATFGLNNGGPYWTLAALFWCIPVDSCSRLHIVLAFFAFSCSTWVWPICIQMLWGLNMANQAPSSAFVSCMRRLLTSPRDSKKRWAVNCDRCKFGDNDKSITSMRFYEHKWAEFGRFVCLWTNIVCYWLGRSNLSAQQKPLRPRKFKSYNSSWQRPAQTIQIRTDKNMSADFCYELLLEEMQSRVWELQ